MSIINSYYKNSGPKIKVEDIYEKSDVVFDSFIVTFSHRIITALLEDKIIELISEDGIRTISCVFPVYRFIGTNIGIVKTTVGAPITSVLIEEVSYIYSCKKAVIFGTCGSLDKNITANSLIVPTDAFYRETEKEINLRKNEGCISVEMELAACQAVANYANIELYGFLYTADNLDSSSWEKGQRDSLLSKDKRLQILNVALAIAKNIATK